MVAEPGPDWGKIVQSAFGKMSRDKLIELATARRTAALRPESRRKHSETLRRHQAALRAWRSAPKTAWPDEAAYFREIHPKLASVTIANISSVLGVCESYAADIRAGRRHIHSIGRPSRSSRGFHRMRSTRDIQLKCRNGNLGVYTECTALDAAAVVRRT
jgi:hypothetical protein